MVDVNEYIQRAHHLVPAPPVLAQLLPLLNRSDADNSKVVELISYNPTLTAGVLKVCNSAFYSRGTPIDNLQNAVTRLGSKQLTNIVVTVTSAATLSRPQKGYGVEAGQLWDHAVTTAVAAEYVAKDLQIDDQVVFTAALLHDLGKIVLSVALEEMYEKVVHETEHNSLSPLEVEMKLLGVTHAEVGGRLLEIWKLPPNLIAAIRHHHQPSAAGEHQRLASCVYIGNFIAYFMGHGYGRHSLDLRARDETLKILGLTAEQMPGYMEKSFERLNAVKHLYGVK